ncbi:unnamed protein product, partial [Heterosigma akashiwo]
AHSSASCTPSTSSGPSLLLWAASRWAEHMPPSKKTTMPSSKPRNRQQRLATRLLGRLLGQRMLCILLCRYQHHHAHQLPGQQLAGRRRKGCLRYTAAQAP